MYRVRQDTQTYTNKSMDVRPKSKCLYELNKNSLFTKNWRRI